MNAEDWIIREDSVTQQDRVTCLQWLLDKAPKNEIWLFHGGMLSQELFEQTRYCFVYGLYLATIILGLSFIEHTLGALFFTSGRIELERASISKLIQEAFTEGWINQQEKCDLDQANKSRNDVTHYRKPSDKNSLVQQTKMEQSDIETLLEHKAAEIMLIVFKILSRFSVR